MLTKERRERIRELAKKVWPLIGVRPEGEPEEADSDPLIVGYSNGEMRITNDYEEDQGGLHINHPTRAVEAAEAALLVLLGPPAENEIVSAQRLAEIERQADGDGFADWAKLKADGFDDLRLSSYLVRRGEGAWAVALSPDELKNLVRMAHLGSATWLYQRIVDEAQKAVDSANSRLEHLELALKNIEPSEKTRDDMMSLCQDQGELTTGDRVDYIVDAYNKLIGSYQLVVKQRDRLHYAAKDRELKDATLIHPNMEAVVESLRLWFRNDGAEGEGVHRLINAYTGVLQILARVRGCAKQYGFGAGADLADHAFVLSLVSTAEGTDQVSKENAELRKENHGLKEDLLILEQNLKSQPDMVRDLIVRVEVAERARKIAEEIAARNLARAELAEGVLSAANPSDRGEVGSQ